MEADGLAGVRICRDLQIRVGGSCAIPRGIAEPCEIVSLRRVEQEPHRDAARLRRMESVDHRPIGQDVGGEDSDDPAHCGPHFGTTTAPTRPWMIRAAASISSSR